MNNTMKPDFIGIGAQKCASAWLYNILLSHPLISMATPQDGDKDTRFFSYFYDRGFEWYERYFEKRGNGIAGEYSTSYLYSLDAPERIHTYSPEIRLIVSLRHPVERAFSNHKHEISLGRVSGENLIFENALKNNPLYLYQSLYYTHLSRWLHYFDKKQIFIILVDDLKEKPEETIHALYEFLGIDSEHKPPMLYERIHETRIPQNRMVESSVRKASVLLRKIGGSTIIDYLKNRDVHRKIYTLNSKSKEEAFLPMKEATRASLLQYFAEENRKLADLINRDLSHWNR